MNNNNICWFEPTFKPSAKNIHLFDAANMHPAVYKAVVQATKKIKSTSKNEKDITPQ